MPATGPALCKVQRFTVERIDRRVIKNAPYNPRAIDRYARKKLEEVLRRDGLVQTLVWNRRTCNLVAGHQRLAIIDALEGTEAYSLDVSVVDVTSAAEKRLNVALNNPGIQGTWDIDLLGQLLEEGEFKADEAGFTPMDLQILFEDKDVASFFNADNASVETKKTKTDIDAIKAAKKRYAEKKKGEKVAGFYVVAVFQSDEAKAKFLDILGLSATEEYIDGSLLTEMLKRRIGGDGMQEDGARGEAGASQEEDRAEVQV